MNDVQSFYRGTLRRKGFCIAWSLLVKLGYTSDEVNTCDTLKDLTEDLIKKSKISTIEIQDFKPYLTFLGLFDLQNIEKGVKVSQVLLNQVVDKLRMFPSDKDEIIMHHEFTYSKDNKDHIKLSTLKMLGKNELETAMSTTVSLPIYIYIMGLVNKEIILEKGIHLPLKYELVDYLMVRLEENGVKFEEHTYMIDE